MTSENCSRRICCVHLKGNFALSFTFEILLANGEVFGNPFYFEFERIVDYTEPTDTSSNITDTNSTTITTSDLNNSTTTTSSDMNNSTTTDLNNVTESSLPPEGPQISIPAGLPGFELMIVLIAIIAIPILRSKTYYKIKV